MPRGIRSAWLTAAVWLLLSAPAHAQTSGFSGRVALASQLVDRGLAITSATPVLEGSVSWASRSGWSLGLAGAVELRAPDHLVVALARASYGWELAGDWHARAGLVYYDYATDRRRYSNDRTDASLFLTWRDVLTLGFSVMRDVGANRKLLAAAEVGLRWPLSPRISVSAGAGIAQTPMLRHGYGWYQYGSGPSWRHERPGTRTYGYGQLGLAWNKERWHLELDRVISSLETRQARYSRASSRWVLTMSVTF